VAPTLYIDFGSGNPPSDPNSLCCDDLCRNLSHQPSQQAAPDHIAFESFNNASIIRRRMPEY
jgi:hypothetical protein